MPRADKLRKLLKNGEAAYITSYPNVFYYSGFQSPDASLIISQSHAVIITDSRYIVQAKQQAPDFELYNIKDGIGGAFGLVHADNVGFEEESLSVGALERLKEAVPGCSFFGMQKAIDRVREIKDKDEILRLRAAEELGDAAFAHLLDFLRAGVTEREAAFELEFFMRKHGASGLSFETIVASGVRSSMPHGVASGKVIEKGDLVTLDFGCVLDGYCSDMTRTVGIGNISDRAREIYQVVLDAQLAGLAAAKAGADLAGVDAAAREIITAAGYGDNFGHALGHSVGVEIHENPCFSPRAKGTLQSGNVLSVEPGIYIEGFGGVRIEDLIAVCDDKTEILSKSPKDLILL